MLPKSCAQSSKPTPTPGRCESGSSSSRLRWMRRSRESWRRAAFPHYRPSRASRGAMTSNMVNDTSRHHGRSFDCARSRRKTFDHPASLVNLEANLTVDLADDLDDNGGSASDPL